MIWWENLHEKIVRTYSHDNIMVAMEININSGGVGAQTDPQTLLVL